MRKLKTGDKVVVITGSNKGSEGKITKILDEKVIVEGVAVATKHTKPRRQGETGGIVKQEAAIDASKVMHVCSKCGKATRIARKVLENGKRVRVCKHCNETFND